MLIYGTSYRHVKIQQNRASSFGVMFVQGFKFYFFNFNNEGN